MNMFMMEVMNSWVVLGFYWMVDEEFEGVDLEWNGMGKRLDWMVGCVLKKNV